MGENIFKRALEKTRKLLSTRVEDLFVPGRTLELDDIEIIEEALISADVGVVSTEKIIERLKKASRDKKMPTGGVVELLENEILEILKSMQSDNGWRLRTKPHVVLLVGVNGTGKTTCAGKLAKKIIDFGGRPLLCASDTFRAAAGEQIAIWAQRVGADIVQSAHGADPASVAFDAVKKAIAGGHDAVIVDTAGRLHTKMNLMEELKKISRVIGKALDGAPHDVFLVLDATTGNNGLSQAKIFSDAVGLTGIILTKLDGTSKGGIALAIVHELGVPIRMIGVGEKMEDLIDFDPYEFTEALFKV